MNRFLPALLLTVGILAVGLSIIPDVHAATLRGGQNYSLPQGATLEGDLYVAGNGIVFSGTTTGDAVLLGANIETQSESKVEGDVFVAAGSALLSSNVQGDVRAVAGELTFRGSTTEDAVLVGGTVIIEPGARIGGDLIVFAERFLMKGVVEGTVDVHAQTVEIDGVVQGSVTAVVGASVSLRDGARVGGDFSYTAPRAAFITEGAQISGNTNFERAAEGTSAASEFFAHALWFIVSLTGSALIFALLRRRVTQSVHTALAESTNVLLWGLGTLVLLPLGALLVSLTFVGIFVGLWGLLVWGILIVVGFLLGPIFAGTLTAVLLTKRREMTFAWIAVGAAVLELMGMVPFVGFLVGLMVLLLGMGVTARTTYRALTERSADSDTAGDAVHKETPSLDEGEPSEHTSASHERQETG